jgi:hypothetical protein
MASTVAQHHRIQSTYSDLTVTTSPHRPEQQQNVEKLGRPAVRQCALDDSHDPRTATWQLDLSPWIEAKPGYTDDEVSARREP